jgi:hypothetical protein
VPLPLIKGRYATGNIELLYKYVNIARLKEGDSI